MLDSQMAGMEDNNGAFGLVLIKARPGVESAPYVHSREHEAMYLILRFTDNTKNRHDVV